MTGGISPADQMLIGTWERGSNGITFGTNNFQVTALTGNFQNNMIGYPICILGKGAYTISAVGSADSITLADHNLIGWPAAGTGLDFYVPSGETPYEIASVDSGTQFTLVKPWSGPTLTGMETNVYRVTYLIGDESGVNTDGIGGVVRVTGSNNDTSATRANCVWVDGKDHYIIRGFRFDSTTSHLVRLDEADHITIEDCRMVNPGTHCVDIDIHDNNHVRRCVLYAGEGGNGVNIHGASGSEKLNVVENCYIQAFRCVSVDGRGGTTVKNLTSGPCNDTVLYTTNLSTGNCTFIHSSEVMYTNNVAIWATVRGMIIEDYNNLYQCSTRVWIGEEGPNSAPAPNGWIWIPNAPWLVDGFRYPAEFLTPSQWSPINQRAGLNPRNHDLFGR